MSSDLKDLKKETAMRDELLSDQERELRLQSKLIEEQKEMVDFFQKHISRITDIIKNA